MRFETSDPAVDWLNRILGLARGARDKATVRLGAVNRRESSRA